VVKQDGRREEFVREKLLASLTKACVKRPLPTGTLEKIAEEIENHLMDTGRSEVSTKVIGEAAVERLRDLDPVAYVRFVSVYKDFRDIEGFKETIKALLEPEEPEETSSQLSLLPEDTITPRRRAGRLRRKTPSLPSK
jgi:transcriptional repressor NrdR